MKHEVIIRLGPGDGDGTDQTDSPRRRGVLPVKKQPDPLARRLGGVTLIVHDPGQVNVGSEEHPELQDLDFRVPIVFEQLLNDVPDYYLNSISNFRLPEWQALQAKMFEIPLKDWEKKYPVLSYDDGFRHGVDLYTGTEFIGEAIAESENYHPLAKEGQRRTMTGDIDTGAPVVGENKFWQKSGDFGRLVLKKNVTAITFICGLGFPQWAIGYEGFERWKVTTEPDYAAPAVKLNLSGESHIFPFPMPLIQYNTTISFSGPVSGEFGSQDLWQGDYIPVSRDKWLNNATVDFWEHNSLLGMYIGTSRGVALPIVQEIADYAKLGPNAARTTRKFDVHPANPFAPPEDYSLLDQSNAAYFGLISIGFGPGLDPTLPGSYGVAFVAGAMVAVITTKTKTYYIWSNDDPEITSYRDYNFRTVGL